ncbi:MAG TPA: PQQ-binding-like beta-propeller repeat protein [Bryobacteraceae bacterium]|jgi:alcohol dehydrogenase (cytochrome c)
MRAAILLATALLTACGAKIASGTKPSPDWAMYNGDYASTRFSPLTEITPQNVSTLRQICEYELPEKVMFESGIVAVDGTLYFTTFENTYAIDAATCALKWRAQHKLEQVPQVGTTRGVAIAGNRVFRGAADGYVVAYDAANGNEVWAVRLTAPDSLESISAAPIAWNGMVFIGTAGADQGNICRVAALDAATGKVLWSFPLVPTGGEANAESWPKGAHVSGGSTWTSYTLDTDTGALYVPAGNPAPDFAGDYRPGANLYAGSVVVLDAKTGALRTWYQLVPHDVHDWDIAAAPALISTKQGQRRAMAAGKDGFLHAIDISSGKVAWKTPVTTIDNIDAPLTPKGTHFCPGTAGGVEWNGPAYSPVTNLLYVNSVDWCAEVKLDTKPPKFEAGKPFVGSANGFGTMDEKQQGWLTAVDADTGSVRWKFQSATPMVAGVLVTASGLAVTGDLKGDLLAFDAATGNQLHRIETHQPVGGGVIAYQQAGKQRIAAAAGLDSIVMRTKGQPTVLVFGL